MKSSHIERSLTKQAGLTLMELMVSLVIGMFLLGGLATNLISTSKLDKSRQAVSEMDANAQLTLDFIRQAVAHAGYPSTRNIHLEKSFFSEEDGEPTNPDCRGGGIQRDIDGTTPDRVQWTRDSPLSDVLTVVSLADNPCLRGEDSCASDADASPQALVYIDCADGGRERDERTVACSTDVDSGMHDPTEAKLFNTFRLNTLDRTLICEGNRGGQAILADGVYAMQFLYGVRSATGDTTYKNADTIEANREWGLVNSVQVALLMESSQDNVSDQDMQNAEFRLLDQTITIPEDLRRHIYRVYTSTINLANTN